MLLSKKMETILICIILIIVGILLILNRKNNIENFSESKIKINYLSAKKAAKVFLNSEKFPQADKFRSNEIYARTTYYGSSSNIKRMREIAKKIYSKNTINFTEADKFKINNVLNSLKKRIMNFNNKNNTNFPVMKTWNLIKISSDIDWGFPYTIDNYIVISDDFITNVSKKQMLSTLFHEQFHIYQRKYPIIFKKLYSKWNFQYIKNFKLPSKIDDNIPNQYVALIGIHKILEVTKDKEIFIEFSDEVEHVINKDKEHGENYNELIRLVELVNDAI